jgi:hypothetical protein
MRITAASIVLALVGCADNAILEVELDLPAANADTRYAVVQGRSGEVDFDATWAGGGVIDGLELSNETMLVGIEADDGGEIDAPLALRIRYCIDPACGDARDGEAQEIQVTVERAFYEGEYTLLRAEALPLPDVIDCTTGGCAPERVMVEKCRIEGCRAGMTINWCNSDGLHFCEE